MLVGIRLAVLEGKHWKGEEGRNESQALPDPMTLKGDLGRKECEGEGSGWGESTLCSLQSSGQSLGTGRTLVSVPKVRIWRTTIRNPAM